MKRLLFIFPLFISFFAYSKSGVNTRTPASTLDITAIASTGTSATVDGLLIPRVDRQRAQSMTAVPTSTLIYVSSIATGTQTGTALNIDAVGHYYYNGTTWTKSIPGPINIYNADGTLTGNRTVTQAANTLALTGTATNAFSVDGTTLSVDAANNRVGIGTITPQKTLHVNGSLQLTGELNTGGTSSTAGNAGAAGETLISNGAGTAPSWKPLNNVTGTIASANYVSGTDSLVINAGTTASVPGVIITLVVPTGKTQTFLFTVLGYATKDPSSVSSQGVFSLLQDGVKICSAYESKVGVGGGGLVDLPVPVTFLNQ